jgi:hypothetical protein
MDEFKGLREGLEVVEVALFEARVVERVEVIEGPDRVPGMQQPLADVRANKTRPTSDQEVHAGQATKPRGWLSSAPTMAGFPDRTVRAVRAVKAFCGIA